LRVRPLRLTHPTRGARRVHPMSDTRAADDRHRALAARYDALWHASAPSVREGAVTLDAFAFAKADDARRGVTLLARPSAAVARAITGLLDELRAIEPAQYYQPVRDLHVTVLSLFTATVDHAAQMARVDDFRAAVAEAVDGAAPFDVDLTGVTLAPAAVLARGFPHDDTLERVRERLRQALAARGLGSTLDQRYRLTTAHTTLVRFAHSLRSPARFVDALDAARDRPFGTFTVNRLELVLGDWYQSSERAEPLATYRLGRGA
jgi:2'-5' RNA ligase